MQATGVPPLSDPGHYDSTTPLRLFAPENALFNAPMALLSLDVLTAEKGNMS